MKLGKIIKTVGSSLLRDIVPGAGIVIDTINAVLPKNKKLDVDTATGNDVTQAVNSLPPDKQADLLSKEFDVEIEEIRGFTERFQAAMEADKTGNSTRPRIALMMGRTVCFTVITSITALFIAIFTKNFEMVKYMADLWPLMLTILATPTALLRAYFAMRSKEKEARYQMASDQEISPGNLITKIVKAIRK